MPILRTLLALAALLVLALAGCNCNKPPQAAANNNTNAATQNTGTNSKAPLPKSIGSATMKKDGTIVLQLRATGEGGLVGDALFTYKKGHHRYDKIIERVGGLEPGQSKPVPPWPDK